MATDVGDLLTGEIESLVWCMFRESAKRQPLDALILTPKGFSRLGNLNVGDLIIGSDGKPTKIIFMSPIVNRPIFRITTEDGRSAECDSDHLWTVRRMSKGNYKNRYVTLSLDEIMNFGLYYRRKPDRRNNRLYKEYKFALETMSPAETDSRELPIDPYVLGALLGDGHFDANTGFASFTCHKDDLPHFRNEFAGHDISSGRLDKRNSNTITTNIRKLGPLISRLGLKVIGKYKFIPEDYLYGSISQRKAMLEGLMDTDGTVSSGTASYCSVSEKLIDGVVSLVRSLGGRATKTRNHYGNCISWRISILFTDYTPFRLQRKRNKHKISSHTFSRIVSIEPIENKLGRCIKVANSDGLYVTNDYLLTHNTSFAKGMLLFLIANAFFKYPNVDAYDRENAERLLFDVVINLQKNPRFREDYGDLFNAPKSSQEKQAKRVSDFVTNNGVRVEAHTTQESVRGRLHEHNRPDFILADDFETLVTVRSEIATTNVQQHFSEFRGGIDQKTGRTMFLCNWLSDDATVAKLKKKAENDHKMRFREVWITDPKTGRPSWPERHVLTDDTLDVPGNEHKISIESIRRNMRDPDTGDADFEREMNGNPVDPFGSGPDKQGWIPLFDGLHESNNPFVPNPPFIIGVDPAGAGSDETAVVIRSAFQAKVCGTEKISTPKSVALMVVEAMKEYRVPAEKVIVDAFGIGFKTVRELAIMGHIVTAVNVGELTAYVPDQHLYQNDRAIIFFALRDWLAQGGILCAHPQWKTEAKAIRHQTNASNKRMIIPKKEIIKRGHKSPNVMDALALTFMRSITPRKRPPKKKKPNSVFDRHSPCPHN